MLKRSSPSPVQLWVAPSAGLPRKSLAWGQPGENKPFSNPQKPRSHRTWQNTWPQTTSREFSGQWKHTWSSRMLTVHPVKQRGSPTCLQHGSSRGTDGNFSAKCKAVKKMSEKDSSVATFFNLNWQVKRNINCLFMSSPPTADWCRIQFKVALKCKVGVIIFLKYFSSF